MSNMIETTAIETRLAERINPKTTDSMALATNRTGGISFSSMSEVMEFAKLIAISNVGVRKHLRGNVGACLAVTVQAIEWEMSPFAVANKSYLVNDQIAYEAQLINAVVLRRAPIVGRFKIEYEGNGDSRVCRVSVHLKNGEGVVEYVSPPFSKITPKNSPLWKSDPDQQLFYFSSRSLCRRHFPDVLLGVYEVDELIADDHAPTPGGPRDVTPRKSLSERIDALADMTDHDPETGEIISENINQDLANQDSGSTRAPPPDNEGAEVASPSASASSPDGNTPTQIDALIAEGKARAEAGRDALKAWLDGLSDEESTLVSQATRRAFTATAMKVSAKETV